MTSILTQGGVELLENFFVEVTLMILAEQIENIGWKHEPLAEFDGAWLEWRIHGIITAVLMTKLHRKQLINIAIHRHIVVKL